MECKKIAKSIPQDLIDSLDYKEGDVYWKHKVSRVTKKGQLASHIKAKGRDKRTNSDKPPRKMVTWPRNKKTLGVKTNAYLCSRIIHAMFYGDDTTLMIDHKDGNSLNDKIENLRKATSAQNNFNRVISPQNTTGHKNVSVKKRNNGKKYYVGIVMVGDKQYHAYYNKLTKSMTYPFDPSGYQKCQSDINKYTKFYGLPNVRRTPRVQVVKNNKYYIGYCGVLNGKQLFAKRLKTVKTVQFPYDDEGLALCAKKTELLKKKLHGEFA
jgi:hypothetical protein